MRRVIPLLSLLLLLCACGTGPSASAPEDSRRLVIFTARSAAVYDDAVREFERRTGLWVEVRTADGTPGTPGATCCWVPRRTACPPTAIASRPTPPRWRRTFPTHGGTARIAGRPLPCCPRC